MGFPVTSSQATDISNLMSFSVPVSSLISGTFKKILWPGGMNLVEGKMSHKYDRYQALISKYFQGINFYQLIRAVRRW